jgi:DNA-binding CsgD family transcriptional regulator
MRSLAPQAAIRHGPSHTHSKSDRSPSTLRHGPPRSAQRRVHDDDFAEGELNRLGYTLLGIGDVAGAVRIFELVACGLLNKQVGGELGISEITVKAHRGQVMRKTRAASLPALVNMAGRLGLEIATIG